jgi:hypothetical protein
MRRILPLLLLMALIMPGCGSSKKSLEKGNYDASIDQAVRQLRKDPDDKKQMATLETAYKIANDQDNERIRFLKMEGKPNNWDEIYIVYKRMYDRQALVKTIPGSDFPYVDYMPDMLAAKRKAADFYYAHGVELMKGNLKDSYRQAFYEFVRAKEYIGDYEGIDNKIAESKELGMSRVFVALQNKSIIKFPKEFEEQLLALDLPSLNSEWVEYHTVNLDQDARYDYFINVNVVNVLVTPDQTVQRDSVIKREIEDGYSYVLDKKGNVMKDSLGNDIRVKKYKPVQCALIETFQSKSCRIDGDVEVVQATPAKLLKKDPIGATSNFEHVSARALGDIQALNARQLEKTKSQPMPFPTDIDMVIRCSDNLKMAIRGAIQNNRRFIL